MADSKMVQKLDEKLVAEGILDSAYKDDYIKVHLKLNAHYKKSGAVLPSKIFEKNEIILRKWLGELYKKGASQERLTSYLRCGLAHLSFDFIESSYQFIDSEDLVTRALQSFKNREFQKTYYKATDTAVLVKKKRAVKKKASKKPAKKAGAARPRKKKRAIKKKPKKSVAVKPKKKKKLVKKKASGASKTKKAAKKIKRKKPAAKKTAKTKPKSKKAVKKTGKKTSKKTGKKKSSFLIRLFK